MLFSIEIGVATTVHQVPFIEIPDILAVIFFVLNKGLLVVPEVAIGGLGLVLFSHLTA